MLRRRINVRVNAVEVGSELIVGTPKTHKVRSVPVIASLLPQLANACEGKGPDELVFSSALGTHVRRAPTGPVGSLERSATQVSLR